MPFVIKEVITQEDKEELLTGLRAYNQQFVDTSGWGISAFTCVMSRM